MAQGGARFMKHDRVYAVDALARQFPGMERLGRVFTDQRDVDFVRVVIDGRRKPVTYASSFWQRVRTR